MNHKMNQASVGSVANDTLHCGGDIQESDSPDAVIGTLDDTAHRLKCETGRLQCIRDERTPATLYGDDVLRTG